MRVQPLAVTSPLGPLPGVLTLPEGKGPFPAVVLVGGSGAHDRDETIGPNKPFRDLAVGLARHGIASLRYDKRTYAYGVQMAGKAITVDDEVTDDALTASHVLGKQVQIVGRDDHGGAGDGERLRPVQVGTRSTGDHQRIPGEARVR